MAAVAVTDAAIQAQWRPFGDGFGTSPPSRENKTRSDRSLPTTTQHVLVSRETLAGLDHAIRRYEAIVSAGGWPVIPDGPTMKYGTRDNRVAYLRHRLLATGELTRGDARAKDYNGDVQAAVTIFQVRNGLTPSGEVNRYTLRALNVPATQRLHQLRLNRDRLGRILGKTEGKSYILVNVPGYELQAVSRGRLDISSRVVVGKPTTPTPEVSASVRAVNILPYWHVPQSIAHRALIPAVKKDPNYLAKEHIRVFASWGGAEVSPAQINWWAPQGKRYVFRQDPGPFNALGLIRLDMPNRHIVYMHDTPLKKLFDYHLRPYSAGCIRVQQIRQLAGWVLSNEPGGSHGRVVQAIQQGQQKTFELSRPIPVHIVYVSAWATPDGLAHFRMDIYDKDKTDGASARTVSWQTDSRSVAP